MSAAHPPRPELPPVPEAPHPQFPSFRIGRAGSLGSGRTGRLPRSPKPPKPPRLPGTGRSGAASGRESANNRQPAPIIHIHQHVAPVSQPKDEPEARTLLSPRGQRAKDAREHLRDVLGDIPANRLVGLPAEARELTRQYAALHARDYTKQGELDYLEAQKERLRRARRALEPTKAEQEQDAKRAGGFGQYNFREQMKDIGAEAYARDEAQRKAEETE